MKVGIICIIIFYVSSNLAQFVLQNGTCPDFNDCRYEVEMTKEKLLGIWYLESSIPYAFQLDHKCTYYNFTVQHEPNTIRFDKFEINKR